MSDLQRTRGPVLVSILLLVLAPLVFYSAMVLNGQEPAAPDTLAHKPVGAWAVQAEESEGRSPDWFPYIFSGMPSYGSFLYIPRPDSNLLGQFLQLFPENRGARYALLFALGGIFAFAFFRRQGFSNAAATTAGLLYSLTPYFPGAVAAGHSTKLEALCLAPAVLWAADRWLDRPGPGNAALLAYFTALLAWANHPQILYYVAMVVFLYALGRWGLVERDRWVGAHGLRIVIYGLLAAIVAAALVAVPYLGIQEYTPYSIRGAASALAGPGGETGVGWDYATAWSFPPGELVSFLFPAWYGLEGATYWGALPFTQSTHYIGILALVLGLFGLVRSSDPRRWIWGGISLVLLLVGFGRYLPVVYRPLYDLLPLFDRFRVPSMIYSLLPLTFGYLVCLGLDGLGSLVATRVEAGAVKRGKGKKAAGSRPAWAMPALVGLGAVLVLWVLLLLGVRGFYSGADAMLRPQELGRYAPSVLGALREQRMDLLVGGLHHGLGFLALALAVVSAAGFGWLPGSRVRSLVVIGLGVLAVLDVWIVDRKFYAPEEERTAAELVPVPGAARYLADQPGPFRILPMQSLFGSNAFATMGLESVGGYQPAKLRIYEDLLESGLLNSQPVLRMLNVRYLLAAEPLDLGIPPVFQGDGEVYPLGDAAGPAWSVREAVRVPDPVSVLRRMSEPGFDPGRTALFTEGRAPDRSEFSPARVELVERGLHRIRLRTRSEGPSLVVLSEIYYPPAWSATIDGEPATILQANHVLRALEVPAGDHEIEMVYRSPARARAGLLNKVGLASLAVLVLLGLLSRRRQSRSSSSRTQ